MTVPDLAEAERILRARLGPGVQVRFPDRPADHVPDRRTRGALRRGAGRRGAHGGARGGRRRGHPSRRDREGLQHARLRRGVPRHRGAPRSRVPVGGPRRGPAERRGSDAAAGDGRRRDAASALGPRIRRRDPREPWRRGEDERGSARTLDVGRRSNGSRSTRSPAGRSPMALRLLRRGLRVPSIPAPRRLDRGGCHRPGSPRPARTRSGRAWRRRGEWRRRTQPLAEPNCGSVFKNPDGDHAARLIESSGSERAPGRRERASPRSTRTSSSRTPGASASDVWALIGQVRSRVESHAGIRLETEVELMGAIGDADD